MTQTDEPLKIALEGRYRIQRVLGRGGMAIVYLADDLRHDRQVAIKVLRPELSSAIAGERFLQEIAIAARLTHPHILPLYDSGGAGDTLFYVMPYVRGESLRDRLTREGALPFDAALRLLDEIAGALTYAHAQGIVHRDIKPENVLIVEGHAVVCDFGIARALDVAGAGRLTATGVAVGTPAYMSPEQATGDPVDARSDVYSLGCVAYEMIGGEPPFMGSSARAVISRHVADMVPPLRTLRASLPPGVQDSIERALAKSPADRFTTPDAFAAGLRSGVWSRTRRVVPRTVVFASAVASMAIVLAVGWLAFNDDGGRAVVQDVRQLTWEEGPDRTPTLSPDGEWIAYEHRGDIHLRRLGARNSVNLTPNSPVFDGEPAFSPDGRFIAFSSRRDGGDTRGGIWLIDATGGAPRRLTIGGFAPNWSPDGNEIAFVDEYTPLSGRVGRSALRVVHVRTGAVRVVSDADAAQPAWSPNGHRIAYWRGWQSGQPAANFDIWTIRPDGSDPRPVTADPALYRTPTWSADGRSLYFLVAGRGEGARLWRVPIDERSGRVRGRLEPVGLPALRPLYVTIGRDDRIAFESGDFDGNLHRVALDRGGQALLPATAVTSGTRRWNDIDIAPDGRIAMWNAGTIYVADSTGGGLAPMDADDFLDRFPRWAPDGRRIAVTTLQDGGMETWLMEPGTGKRRLTFFEDRGAGFFPLWAPDGTRLLITTGLPFGGWTFVVDPARPWSDAKLDSLPLAPNNAALRYRPWSWSPDGRRLVAYSERGAGLAVYDFASREWRLLTRSGAKPRWLSDSRRLVYSDSGKLFIADADRGSIRLLHAEPGYQLIDPAVAPGDRYVYYVRLREESDLWVGMIR